MVSIRSLWRRHPVSAVPPSRAILARVLARFGWSPWRQAQLGVVALMGIFSSYYVWLPRFWSLDQLLVLLGICGVLLAALEYGVRSRGSASITTLPKEASHDHS